MPERQIELSFENSGAESIEVAQDDKNILFLVELLRGKGWNTARELMATIESRTGHTVHDRYIRALASASAGQIAGGQRGYKLVQEMTSEEYQHWRNWMMSQSDEMKRRVVEADRIFYGRKPV